MFIYLLFILGFGLALGLPPDSPLPPKCIQPKEPGPCRAAIPRYYFDKWHSGKCEHFIYGGCNGNYNNFETLKECQHACMPDKK